MDRVLNGVLRFTSESECGTRRGVWSDTMPRTYLSELVWQRSSESGVSTRERMGLGATSEAPSVIASQTESPTIASTWKTVAESPITDDLLDWPADLFALTNLILSRSEAYRLALSPPSGEEWPPRRFPSWSDAVAEASGQWSAWLEDRECAFPNLLLE